MTKIPATVEKRLKSEIPKFQKILSSARNRDVNEADTVVIVTDIMEKVFGMDKYEDLTREHAISGTFVDLAVVTKNKIDYLIEVKAIGISLKENHLRQAVNYAAKEGVKWAVLTNGIDWQIHRVLVEGQVSHQLILAFDFLQINSRSKQDISSLYMLCKRAVDKDLIEEFYEHKRKFNRYTVGSILITDDVLKVVRRTLKKLSPALKVSEENIKEKIIENVLKREILDSESGIEAQKLLKKSLSKLERAKKKKSTPNPGI